VRKSPDVAFYLYLFHLTRMIKKDSY